MSLLRPYSNWLHVEAEKAREARRAAQRRDRERRNAQDEAAKREESGTS